MISDSDWIKANPERAFRLRAPKEGEGQWDGAYGDRNLRPATLIDISESRRVWGIQKILVFGEIVDTDEAAKNALTNWDKVIFPRLLDAAHRRGGA